MTQNGDFKIFCIGSNLESYESLKFLVEKKCKIHTLITLPSSLSEGVSDYIDLHDFCIQNGINVIDTRNVNSKETVEAINKLKPDYLFTLGWSQIFKEEFIASFSKFVVGTHPSKLPHGRGRAPLPWTVLEGLDNSAVSFFKIDTGVDTGKLIFQREFEIPKGTYVKDLYDMVAKELGLGFYEIYKLIENGETIHLSDQGNTGVTVRGKRTPEDGLIEFDQDISSVEKLIRAVSEPYPGAYFYYKDQKIIIWEVEFDLEKIYSGTKRQILKKGENKILVQFANGTLWLKRPTQVDGRAVDLKFFKIGDKLGYNVQDEIFKLKTQKNND